MDATLLCKFHMSTILSKKPLFCVLLIDLHSYRIRRLGISKECVCVCVSFWPELGSRR